MKKTLFLSAILGATLCSNAFAETKEYTGNSNSRMQVGGYGASDEIIFAMTPGGTDNWFNGTQSTAAAILIKDDASTTTVVEGLHINNGNGGNVITFSGAVSGNGAITKKGRGQNLVVAFTGDVTDYTGNITLDSEYPFTLRFGGSDIAAVTTSATEGVAGTGSITFANNGNSTLEFNYTSSANPVYITNAIEKSGASTAKVKFLGGASYVLTKNAAIDELTINNGSTLTVGADATLALKSDSTWTKVGEETPRTVGNGFGTITCTKNFGTSLVNNGTITLDGNAASLSDGVVTGAGNSTTYYVNEAATATTATLSGAAKLVVNSTGSGSGVFALQNNATYGNLNITINGGKVTTIKTGNGTGFTSGDVVINGGGTLSVVGSGQDALGWDNGVKTRSLTLEGTAENNKATFELSYTPDASLTLATNLNMNGHSQVTGTRAFNTYGGVITATGTDNVISAGVQLRKAASFVVNEDSTLLISGNVTYGASNERTMTKTGDGVLTISGNISGNSATELVAITGDGANTIISSGTISHATLNNVKLAKGSDQTITGTVTLNNATLTNRLNVNGGGSLTLQNGATATQTSGFSIVVDGNATLTFEAGTYDLSKPSDGLAIYTGSAMTVKNGASLKVNKICYSYNNPEKNGDVTVEEGGVLNITSGNSYVQTLTVAGTATVGGNIHTEDFLKVNNSYTQTAGTATIEKYLGLAANAGVALSDTGKMVVKGTSTDTGNGIWMGAESTITMGANSTLEVKPVGLTFKNGTITNTSTTDERQVGTNTYQDAYRDDITISADTTVNNGQTVVSGYTFSGGSVTVNSGTTTDINSTLSATTDLTVNSGSTANFTKTNSNVQAISGEGSVNVGENADLTVNAASTIKQLGGLGTVKALADLTVTEAENGKVTLGGMEIAGNTTVTVNDHAGTLTLGSLTVTGSGSTINANLDLSGATVTLNGNSVELGCDLKFDGTAITLSDDDIAAISGAGLLLFSDVESLTLGTTTHTTDYIGLVDASGIILTLAGDATSALPDKVFVNFSATDKTVSLSVVPEPATATLSLLALAGLCARRRRK